MRQIATFSISLFVTLVSGCRAKETSSETPVPVEAVNVVKLSTRQFKAANILLGKVEQKELKDGLQLNGVVDIPPQNMIVVAPQLGGFVKMIHVREGEPVKKGQLLVTLENLEYIQLQQEYLQQTAALQFARTEYERQQELSRENINAAKTLQQARANFESLSGVVNGLEAKLQLLNIRPETLRKDGIRSQINIYAKSSGYVTEVGVNTGQFFGTAETMLKIVDLTHMHVLLHVFEKDIETIRIGQEVRFQPLNGKGEYSAHVYLIGKELTPGRTIRVHCHPDDDAVDLIPGMYLTATVVTDTIRAEVLPSRAIVRYGNQHLIFIARSGNEQFELMEVTTGRTDGPFTEVILPDDFDRQSPVVIGGASSLLGILKNEGGED